MTFVHPGFLWALAALAIPVIIHLFNFQKYKKVFFTNVRWLKQLEEETRSRSRLREWLVLAARCLALTALVFAFAQPFMPDEDQGKVSPGARAVSIYIDNSFSMENVNKQGPLLDIARARARELVNALGNADKFQVITNDFEGRHQRFHYKEEALRVIDEVKVSPATRRLSEVLKRQAEFLRASQLPNKRIYTFSDAQRSTFDLNNVSYDTIIRVSIIPLAGNRVNNVYVDSCWFETPLQQKGFIQKLHARIENKGQSDIEIGSAKLFLNKEQVAIASFSLAAESTAEVKFSFECKEEGFNFGSVRIEDFPVTFDDELFFAFSSRVNVSVCLINGNETAQNPLSSLFSGDSLFRLQSMPEQTIDYSHFRTCDVIILNQLSELGSGLVSELVKFTSRGGSIVIIPALQAKTESYNAALNALNLPALGNLDTMQVKVAEVSQTSGFYSGVFEKISERLNLPVVNKHYRLQTATLKDFEPVLSLQNGEAFLGFSQLNNASIYLFTSPLEESAGNFARHALLVPTFYQLSFRSLRSAPLFYQAASNVMIGIKNEGMEGETPPHIVKKDTLTDIIPGMRTINNALFLLTQGQITLPGFYEVTRNTKALLPLAFNYSRLESDLSVHTASELEEIIASRNLKNVSVVKDAEAGFARQVLTGADGRNLWKLFIFLALLFLAAEACILRLMK